MSRSFIWPCALVLATITGALLAATVTVINTPLSHETRDSANEARVRDFYAAINTTLATGETTHLTSLVAPDFIDNATAPGLPPTREGLIRALHEWRAMFPSLRIVLDDIVAVDDRVVARVRVEGIEDGRFLGLSLGDLPFPWGPIDLFQMAEGQIIEHWGTAASGRLDPWGAFSLDSLSSTPQIVTVTRWVFPPHTRVRIVAGDGLRFLTPETGKLTATFFDSPVASATISPGSILALPKRTSYALSNERDDDAIVVIVDVIPPGASEVATIARDAIYPEPLIDADASGRLTFPGGVTMQPLASSPLMFLPRTPVVEIGRVILAPGATLPSQPADGATFVAVDTGTLDLPSGVNTVALRGHSPAPSGDSTMLIAGDSAFIPRGTMVGFGNRGPSLLTVLVVTITEGGSPL